MEFINKFKKTREDFIRQFRFRNLEKRDLKIIEDIFEIGQPKGLKGKQAEEFYEKIERISGTEEKHEKKLLDSFNKQMETLFEEMLDLKRNVFDCL